MRQASTAGIEIAFGQFVAGDDAAFLTLYEHYNPRFGIYAMKRYRLSFEEAEDILQSVWERVLKLRAKGSLAEIQNFGAFLFRTLSNLAVDAVRRRRNVVRMEDADLDAAEAPQSQTPFALMNAHVLAAFEELNEEHREVLILQLYSGYELSEIAEMLQKSKDAIWARASRARADLRKRVARLAERESIPISEFKVLAR